ncbi:MAG: small subunit ribosomal protein [Patescibacteria group bacterium]|nr:small subunit ribosomal protein [Patescibacteria group bacterium]
MLAIRMQRVGRKGLAHYRMVVQDSRRTPTSGRVISQLGSYDPHSKKVILNKEAAQKYLDNGAQPSERVVAIFKTEGVKLPSWVTTKAVQKKLLRIPINYVKISPKRHLPQKKNQQKSQRQKLQKNRLKKLKRL